jgi:divalent metal cation (Fe/Co/Zn/Cd) transporter
MSLGGFAVGVIVLIVGIYTLYKFIKHCLKHSMEYDAAFGFFLIIPLAISIIAICENTDWIMIKLAPRLYLLEYVKTLFEK